MGDIENALKERGINLFTDQVRHDKFIESMGCLINRSILEPLKSAQPLQQYGRLPDKYTIHREVIAKPGAPLSQEDRNELYSLLPPINIDYYATHSEHYIRDRDYILKINALIRQRENCEILTVNERSYELFDDEKAIDAADDAAVDGAAILKRLRLTHEDIRAKKVFEPFFCREKGFSNRNRGDRTVLIIENKDTFWTFQDAVIRGLVSGIHLVIFGEGKAILRKFEYIETVGGAAEDQYFYFGDIDREGISIYNQLNAKYPQYNIQPATSLYTLILQKAGLEGARPLRTLQRVKKFSFSPFLDYFDLENGELIRRIINNELYLPQEALNITDLQRLADVGLPETL
ncbi:Wadjet anti-phage system protein JetD domain-containing protein [Methanocalculus sp.]|uniref:Wadjet anti-phage system protein JetD domain-containing protein n=1 Tax=Methanocalculus sp. TaxID=2004547 RepID=UPI00260D68FA|nr:Wadjet anti-phage system protein JetD domain-containing protein [Methanocalculus sp.]MDG6249508.1 DUF2220 family protein [Methanocalculus sp.]